MIQVAIDPGSAATGVVFFFRGEAFSKTLYANRKLKLWRDRRQNLVDKVLYALDEAEREKNTTIQVIAVEGFVPYVPPKLSTSLKKLFEYTGYLHGRLEGYCKTRGARLIEICKWRTPKKEAYTLCRAYRFEGRTEHEVDAFHLGVLAGFKPRLR